MHDARYSSILAFEKRETKRPIIFLLAEEFFVSNRLKNKFKKRILKSPQRSSQLKVSGEEIKTGGLKSTLDDILDGLESPPGKPGKK